MRLDFSAATPSPWRVYGQRLYSRFLIGSAGYPSPAVLAHAIAAGRLGDAAGLIAAQDMAGSSAEYGNEPILVE